MSASTLQYAAISSIVVFHAQGDLALLAAPGTRGLPIGHITAHNADHTLNLEFMRALRESCTEEDYVDAVPQLRNDEPEDIEEQQEQQE